MNRTIGIIGCGWLGLPLAKAIVSDGHTVHGTTTSEERLPLLKDEHIHPFLITLTPNGPRGPILKFLESLDVLIINVPPRLRGDSTENYVKKMEGLHKAIKASQIRKIIFVSSTSVYGDVDGTITEETPPTPSTESGRQLLASEGIFKNDSQLRTTIVRFGGLIGPGRHPVTLLSDRKGLSNGGAPINLIHLQDCIGILKSIVDKSWWNETLNAVYPYHPPKMEYYQNEARKRHLPTPEYRDSSMKSGKKISSSKLILVKKYCFNTPI
ncbi:MAG: SDR family oxidoreductase [Bacteroidota bacterium]